MKEVVTLKRMGTLVKVWVDGDDVRFGIDDTAQLELEQTEEQRRFELDPDSWWSFGAADLSPSLHWSARPPAKPLS